MIPRVGTSLSVTSRRSLQQRSEFRRERKHTSFAILGLSGIEPSFAGGEIDLPLFARETSLGIRQPVA